MVLMASAVANAQNEVGQISVAPVVGINLSDVTKYEGSKMKFGIAAGAVAEYGVSEKFGVSLGLIYSQQGCKVKGVGYDGGGDDYYDYYDYYDYDYGYIAYEEVYVAGGKEKLKLDYLNIPILAQYYIFDGFAIKAGVQPSVLLSAKYGSHSIKDDCNKFAVDIPVGLSYEYKNIVLDARYNIGLTKIQKKNAGNKKSNNSVFEFTLGYKFKI